MGLEQALRMLVEPAANQLHLVVTVPPAFPVLAPDTEYTIYRIAQEAVTNVLQHAAAATLRLQLAADRDLLTLCIQDDGIGFVPDDPQPEGHFGLLGMYERAVVAGGQLQVTSRPGTGTTITLTLPR